ncbi:putative acetyltransferase [Smittium mucronatum]|uniref:Putative acetyltransferase n=1 Tax=Smittium mucronatum TaxID=133383 RepID=A0A1R0GZA8_9FUNG|nr:putative acetyltransferase [Smittium mucronatum]
MSKTERQKMLDGEFYLSNDPDLVQGRFRSSQLVGELQKSYNNREERIRITKELLGTCDETTYLEKYAYFDYGVNVHVGKNFYMNAGCVILDCARVDIGDNVMFGPNVQIYTATHPIEAEPRISGKELAYPIKICDNAWIGGGSIVLPGITIGKNSVVAAGAVVTKDVPENVVVGGNPAKIIKRIDNGQ